MPESSIKWMQKLDCDGKPVPNCWVSDAGYKVAKTVTDGVLMITRPDAVSAFAYTPDRDEAVRLILADMKALSVGEDKVDG